MNGTFRLRDLIPIDPTSIDPETNKSWDDEIGQIAYNFIKRRRQLEESELPLAHIFLSMVAESRGEIDAKKLEAIIESIGDFGGSIEEGVITFEDDSKIKIVNPTKIAVLHEEQLDEALTMVQRIKRRQIMKRMKGKIRVGQRRAKKRTASMVVLKRRAKLAAKRILTKRILKNKTKGDASFAERSRVEKMLLRKKGAVERIARKLMPKLRKKEQERRRNANRTKK